MLHALKIKPPQVGGVQEMLGPSQASKASELPVALIALSNAPWCSALCLALWLSLPASEPAPSRLSTAKGPTLWLNHTALALVAMKARSSSTAAIARNPPTRTALVALALPMLRLSFGLVLTFETALQMFARVEIVGKFRPTSTPPRTAAFASVSGSMPRVSALSCWSSPQSFMT
eukprot:2431118-Rhodomonas_salina.2